MPGAIVETTVEQQPPVTPKVTVIDAQRSIRATIHRPVVQMPVQGWR